MFLRFVELSDALIQRFLGLELGRLAPANPELFHFANHELRVDLRRFDFLEQAKNRFGFEFENLSGGQVLRYVILGDKRMSQGVLVKTYFA